MTVLTSSSHRAGQGVSRDHFGSLVHHMVLEITLGYHFRLRSHFSENSVMNQLVTHPGTIFRWPQLDYLLPRTRKHAYLLGDTVRSHFSENSVSCFFPGARFAFFRGPDLFFSGGQICFFPGARFAFFPGRMMHSSIVLSIFAT